MGIVATVEEERLRSDLASCKKRCDHYMAESAGLREQIARNDAEIEGLWAKVAVLEQDLAAEKEKLLDNFAFYENEIEGYWETIKDQKQHIDELYELRPGDLWRFLRSKLGSFPR